MLSKKVVGEREMDNDENLNHSAGNKKNPLSSIVYHLSSVVDCPADFQRSGHDRIHLLHDHRFLDDVRGSHGIPLDGAGPGPAPEGA